MKKIYAFIAIAMLVITLGCNRNEGNQSITVNIDEKGYAFSAQYPKHKTSRVVTYIEKTLKQEDFFYSSDGVKNERVTLSDSSRFNITSEPGRLKINFNKRDNTEIAYQKLVALCKGIKGELK